TWITESGWPTQGESNGAAVPGTANQRAAIDSLKSAFSGNLILFTAYNDMWKSNNAGTYGAEQFWEAGTQQLEIMAWRSSGSSNQALIENLASNGLITQARVKQAMLGVDRAHYAPAAPYQDSPQPIGHRATISAPHMHAAACESLLPYLRPGARVLDIGSGSGYLTHVLAELVKPGGKGDGGGFHPAPFSWFLFPAIL
ncbi:hypothetical protein D0865_16374, partial [Hortaea werneckii]